MRIGDIAGLFARRGGLAEERDSLIEIPILLIVVAERVVGFSQVVVAVVRVGLFGLGDELRGPFGLAAPRIDRRQLSGSLRVLRVLLQALFQQRSLFVPLRDGFKLFGEAGGRHIAPDLTFHFARVVDEQDSREAINLVLFGDGYALFFGVDFDRNKLFRQLDHLRVRVGVF